MRRVTRTPGSFRERASGRTRTVEDLRHGTRKAPLSRMLRPHPSCSERPDRARHRHHDKRNWGSSYTFIYRSGDTFIYIHSGQQGPYWHKGRWHPYRRDRNRALYYGYWIDTTDYYYVNRLEPPWVRRDYWDRDDDVVVVHADYDEPRTRVIETDYEYVDEAVTGDFVLKRQVVDAVIVKELQLSTTESRRVEKLIAQGVLREVLEKGGRRGDANYNFDKRRGLLTLTAPSERIAMIETMVRDERTFEAVTGPNRYGHTVAVIPLVSPFFLERDFREAVRLATDSFEALRSMLEGRDWRDAYDGKACWLNAEFGTATVIHEERAIERAFELIEDLPFVPSDFVREP